MEFGLLGPLVVRSGETEIPVRRGHQRVLLAILLLEANRLVPVEAITDALWGPAPPRSAPVAIRSYIRWLRLALGQAGRERIRTQPRGYLIRVADGELDMARFERLLASARAAARSGCWPEAAGQARAALSCWRGEPLADIASDALALRQAPRLAELRLHAVQTRIDADLRLGGHAEVTPELQHLCAAHPLREHLHALLMLALYRCGRQAEALAAYQQLRATLAEELGADPGTELQTLHQQILRADPALVARRPAAEPMPRAKPGVAGSAEPGAACGSAPMVPRQLPATVAYFTGRAGELAALAQMLDQAGGGPPGAVVISAIGGMAGVGKTALALRWAHQVAPRFGDGQLYVNLRGFGHADAPAPPAEAIRGFLDGLGVAPERIPAGLDAQAGLFRSLLAGKKMLIVLDNARDEQQVRPLLPAGPGCLVLVTSRRQLAGLAAADGARLLTLDLPGHAEARQMLTLRLGAGRAAAEPEAVDQVARLCARLPLALAVAAARARARPRFSLAALAAELSDLASRLDALDAGDPAASVRAVFSWSYQQLSPEAARTFRLLGLHPGPGITVPAAASLTATAPPAAGQALRELTAANLLTEHPPGRYAFHDLLRAYAAEQARSQESGTARRAAVRRCLDHYLHTAVAAALLLEPDRATICPQPPRPKAQPEQLAHRQQALDWLAAERQVLLAAARQAAGRGFSAHAWQLPWALAGFLSWNGYWPDLAATQQSALTALERHGELAVVVQARRLLALASIRLGASGEASTHLAQALQLARQAGSTIAQAQVHTDLAAAATLQGAGRAALGHLEQALRLYREARQRRWEANALNNLGWHHALHGGYQQALEHCQQALAIHRELGGNSPGKAGALDSLGYAHHHLGHQGEAIACYRQALQTLGAASDPHIRAEILTHLGDSHHAARQHQAARESWQQALDILHARHDPAAAQLRSRLASSSPSSSRTPAAQHSTLTLALTARTAFLDG
jgi:DNA-binding SARP family transcriptional activator/tetratricopeptide (TPR) repeat protein